MSAVEAAVVIVSGVVGAFVIIGGMWQLITRLIVNPIETTMGLLTDRIDLAIVQMSKHWHDDKTGLAITPIVGGSNDEE
jgi:hypothetical protein